MGWFGRSHIRSRRTIWRECAKRHATNGLDAYALIAAGQARSEIRRPDNLVDEITLVFSPYSALGLMVAIMRNDGNRHQLDEQLRHDQAGRLNDDACRSERGGQPFCANLLDDWQVLPVQKEDRQRGDVFKTSADSGKDGFDIVETRVQLRLSVAFSDNLACAVPRHLPGHEEKPTVTGNDTMIEGTAILWPPARRIEARRHEHTPYAARTRSAPRDILANCA